MHECKVGWVNMDHAVEGGLVMQAARRGGWQTSGLTSFTYRKVPKARHALKRVTHDLLVYRAGAYPYPEISILIRIPSLLDRKQA